MSVWNLEASSLSWAISGSGLLASACLRWLSAITCDRLLDLALLQCHISFPLCQLFLLFQDELISLLNLDFIQFKEYLMRMDIFKSAFF